MKETGIKSDISGSLSILANVDGIIAVVEICDYFVF